MLHEESATLTGLEKCYQRALQAAGAVIISPSKPDIQEARERFQAVWESGLTALRRELGADNVKTGLSVKGYKEKYF